MGEVMLSRTGASGVAPPPLPPPEPVVESALPVVEPAVVSPEPVLDAESSLPELLVPDVESPGELVAVDAVVVEALLVAPPAPSSVGLAGLSGLSPQPHKMSGSTENPSARFVMKRTSQSSRYHELAATVTGDARP